LPLRGFCLLRCHGAWLVRFRFVRRLPGGLRLLLGRELLLDLARDRGHVHLVELRGFSQGFRGFVGTVRRLQHGDCHQNAANCALVGFAKKRREQFRRGVSGAAGLADAVKAKDDRQTALVQDGGEALGNKEQVALHQPDGNRVAGCFEDAKAGCLGNGFLAAALLLFCLECRICRGLLLAGVVDGAFGIGTDGADFAFLRALGNDGLGGVLARFVFRPVALLLVRGLLGVNLHELVARQGGAGLGRGAVG